MHICSDLALCYAKFVLDSLHITQQQMSVRSMSVSAHLLQVQRLKECCYVVEVCFEKYANPLEQLIVDFSCTLMKGTSRPRNMMRDCQDEYNDHLERLI